MSDDHDGVYSDVTFEMTREESLLCAEILSRVEVEMGSQKLVFRVEGHTVYVQGVLKSDEDHALLLEILGSQEGLRHREVRITVDRAATVFDDG